MAKIKIINIDGLDDAPGGIEFTHAEIIKGFSAPLAIVFYKKDSVLQKIGIPLDLDKGVFVDDLTQFEDAELIAEFAPSLADKIIGAESAPESDDLVEIDQPTRKHGDIIPPRRVRRVGRGRAIPEGWGLSNVTEALRNRSAARLAAARRHKVEEWERFLAALNRPGYQMKEYERTRRSLEKLDETLDAEEAHDAWVLRVERQHEIEEAALSESRRMADRAPDRARGVEQPNVAKKQPKKPSPEERIRQNISRRKELRDACFEYVAEILEAARASGTENSPDVQREIENVKRDFAKEIAKTYEKG